MARKLSRPRRFRYEAGLVDQGVTFVAGVDEAGRGPLAGPVFAAAVIFPLQWICGEMPKALRAINDSKQLTPEEREILFAEITSRREIVFGIAQVDVEMIDQINILQASHRAMNFALAQLNPQPQHVLVDGLRVASLQIAHTALVGGDAISY